MGWSTVVLAPAWADLALADRGRQSHLGRWCQTIFCKFGNLEFRTRFATLCLRAVRLTIFAVLILARLALFLRFAHVVSAYFSIELLTVFWKRLPQGLWV